MIPRYTRKIMETLWSEEEKFRTWLMVEIYACEAWHKLGKIPEKELKEIQKKAYPFLEKGFTKEDVARIQEIEKITKHDVIAFLTFLEEKIGPAARYIHLGMTSSDVLDTAMAFRMKKAMEIIIEDLRKVLQVLKDLAFKYKNTIMIGRTHGIHAEPITFGLKCAIFFEEMKRNLNRLERACENIAFGKISGAVGTFAHLDPYVEEYVCEKMGLKPAPVSNQIIQRDRYAEYINSLAITMASVEKIATEIRHLQRTEVLECLEPFSKGQKGSSAMPHKKNPILCENLCGLARTVRAYVVPTLENVTLWHERDISHSSAERMIIPSATTLTDFALNRLIYVLSNLVVNEKQMQKNLDLLRGLIYSQALLLTLVGKGLPRQRAYEIVQALALKVWEEENLTLLEACKNSKEIKEYLTPEELKEIFNPERYLTKIDYIFKRVFG